MKIVITSISFCEYVIQQANGLAALGHEIMLVMPKQLVNATVGVEIEDLMSPGVKCWLYNTRDRRSLSFYTYLLQAVSGFSPDLLHIHYNGGLETLALIAGCRSLPLVVTIHDIRPHPGTDSRSTIRGKIIKNLLKRCADVIHLHGEMLRKDFSMIQPTLAAKVTIIPHGALSLFKYWEKLTIEKEPLTCLFFGRMEKYRGLDNLVQIGRILKEAVPGIKIIVAGKGTELGKYKAEMADLEIFEVHDAFIPNKDVFRYFGRASLLLLPYHEASQSGVVSMGLPFGIPTVATSVGSIPEVVIDEMNGKILSPGDMSGFAEAVRELLTDAPRLQRMSNHCLETAERLDFRNMAYNFEELYSRAIHRRKSSYCERRSVNHA